MKEIISLKMQYPYILGAAFKNTFEHTPQFQQVGAPEKLSAGHTGLQAQFFASAYTACFGSCRACATGRRDNQVWAELCGRAWKAAE